MVSDFLSLSDLLESLRLSPIDEIVYREREDRLPTIDELLSIALSSTREEAAFIKRTAKELYGLGRDSLVIETEHPKYVPLVLYSHSSNVRGKLRRNLKTGFFGTLSTCLFSSYGRLSDFRHPADRPDSSLRKILRTVVVADISDCNSSADEDIRCLAYVLFYLVLRTII
jgi:hypothetical protein